MQPDVDVGLIDRDLGHSSTPFLASRFSKPDGVANVEPLRDVLEKDRVNDAIKVIVQVKRAVGEADRCGRGVIRPI